MTPVRRGAAFVAGILFFTLVGYPLARLVGEAFRVADSWDFDRVAEPLVGSLTTSIFASILATTAGVAAAFVTERVAVPGRRALQTGFVAPLIVPPFVSAVSWQAAYAPAGIIEDLLGITAAWVESPIGVAAVIAANAAPLAYLVAMASLATGGEADLERAARAAGASPLVVFRTVTLPLLRPAVLAAAALTFVSGMNSFGVPMILGTPSGFGTLTTEIYRDVRRAFSSDAFSEVILMSLVLVVVTTAIALWAGPLRSSVIGLATTRPVRVGTPTRAGMAAAIVSWFYVALTVGFPFVALLLRSITRGVGLDPVPGNWTLAHFADAFGASTAVALGRSAFLALTAAFVVIALASLSVWLRRTGLGRVSALATLGFAIPGTVLAVGVFLGYGRLLGAGVVAILVAYLAKFWALGHMPLDASVDRLAGDVWRAARVSGARPVAALRTVVLPIVWPALAVGWSTVVLFGIHELTMSSLLHGAGSTTMAVVILDLQQTGDASASAALAVIMTLVVGAAAIPLALARRAWRRLGVSS